MTALAFVRTSAKLDNREETLPRERPVMHPSRSLSAFDRQRRIGRRERQVGRVDDVEGTHLAVGGRHLGQVAAITSRGQARAAVCRALAR